MGQFDDLTPIQGRLLRRCADLGLRCDCETLCSQWRADVGAFEVAPKFPRATDDCTLHDVPGGLLTYRVLADLGYILIGEVKNDDSRRISFTLLRRAFDYAAYADKVTLGRWLADLRWDLAHDDTIRSKLLWSLAAIVISTGIAWAMDYLAAIP